MRIDSVGCRIYLRTSAWRIPSSVLRCRAISIRQLLIVRTLTAAAGARCPATEALGRASGVHPCPALSARIPQTAPTPLTADGYRSGAGLALQDRALTLHPHRESQEVGVGLFLGALVSA